MGIKEEVMDWFFYKACNVRAFFMWFFCVDDRREIYEKKFRRIKTFSQIELENWRPSGLFDSKICHILTYEIITILASKKPLMWANNPITQAKGHNNPRTLNHLTELKKIWACHKVSFIVIIIKWFKITLPDSQPTNQPSAHENYPQQNHS